MQAIVLVVQDPSLLWSCVRARTQLWNACECVSTYHASNLHLVLTCLP